MENELSQTSHQNGRSEEVSDIIDRMPVTFGRWAAGIVFFLVLTMSVLGWIIRFPDTLRGQITINAEKSSVKLIANTNGKIYLTGIKPQQKVKEGEYIAIIQNAANNDDIIKIMKLVKSFDINNKYFVDKITMFPKKMSLGELNLKYYTFLMNMERISNYQVKNNFQKKEESLLQYIANQEDLLTQNVRINKIREQTLGITDKALRRDSILRYNFQTLAVSEDEFERTQLTQLNTKENYQNLCKENLNIHLQIDDAKNKIEQNRIEKENTETQLYLDLLSSFNDLVDNLNLWEQRYVFKAPFDGSVDYLRFWNNNQYIQSGQEAFNIIPIENEIIGQVLLPTQGVGKIKIGSEVIIKLDNYPYMEYGSIKGKVKSISLTTNTLKISDKSIETYLVLVELPNELTTNYGSKLKFRYELHGTAEIIANDRRLLQRLFDNLRYRLNK